ncbi:DUF6192 family protein [Streptomyces mirabilis]|uniref:DUF6192 family protein n=1 Tax=Streptomyces mirabilis TaxID=68239 RepID=UPI0036908B6A
MVRRLPVSRYPPPQLHERPHPGRRQVVRSPTALGAARPRAPGRGTCPPGGPDAVARQVTTDLSRRMGVARTAMRDDTARMLVNRAQVDDSPETRDSRWPPAADEAAARPSWCGRPRAAARSGRRRRSRGRER